MDIPADLTWTAITLVSLSAITTSIISAIAGMGGGILLLSIMTFFFPYHALVPVHGIAQIVSNFSRAFLLRSHINKKMFYIYALGVPFGAALSIYLIKSIENPDAALILIGFLLLYTVFKPKKLPPIMIPIWAFFFLGVLCGTLGILIGAIGPLIAPFMLRTDLKKENIIATKASFQIVTHLMKIPSFLYLGFNYIEYIVPILLLIICPFLGTNIGIKILKNIDEKKFRLIFKAALLMAALRIFFYKLS